MNKCQDCKHFEVSIDYNEQEYCNQQLDQCWENEREVKETYKINSCEKFEEK